MRCLKFDAALGLVEPALAVKRFIDERRAWFARSLNDGIDSLEICRAHAAMIDGMIGSLFSIADRKLASPCRAAVLALGGYGRMEMGLHCDIDLLFLHERGEPDYLKAVTDRVLYPLWDNGAEVGGATRTLDDCRRAMRSDVSAFTAMTEARLICGDGSLHTSLMEMIASHLAAGRLRRRFVESKVEEMKRRHVRFGDAAYSIQPNVKEGAGGLRDYHTLMWIARAIRYPQASADAALELLKEGGEPDDVIDAVSFLWRIRHALHLIEGKRSDRLWTALQGPVAAMLGFKEESLSSAPEALLSSYHRKAVLLHGRCERAIERAARGICPAGPIERGLYRRRVGQKFLRTERRTLLVREGCFDPDPAAVLEIFSEARRLRLKVDALTKDLIVKSHAEAGEGLMPDARAQARLGEMFSEIAGLGATLVDMNECGLVTAWFPEMEPMFYRIGSDGVHRYTAGIHSIRAVSELASLFGSRGGSDSRAFNHALESVGRPHVLTLATFLHDVGKGRGGEHAAIGATLAEGAAIRLGFTVEDASAVSFLVRSHLLMTMLAFRRDVRDGALVGRFAQSVRSEEMLAMLYLLTIADLKAVAPGVYNDWKGGLLASLYEKTRASLAACGHTDEWVRSERARRMDELAASLARVSSADEIREFISALPERYLLSTDVGTIAGHILLAREIKTGPLATSWRPIPERSCAELSIVTRDAPGLFADIAGVLCANGANIVDAELYTSSRGLAIDVLWLTDAVGRPFDDALRWQQIRSEIAEAVGGARDIDSIVASRLKERFLSKGRPRRPAEVLVDNDVSALETVVEITSDDRLGLLYTIASTFREMGCTIDRARITTHVDRVIDVFHIRDSQGLKIISREHLERVRAGLMKALEG